MQSRARSSEGNDHAMIWMVLWFGSLWGAAEALAGGFFHLLLPPTYAGRVMLMIAGGLCVYAVRATGRAWMPLAMAAIAAPLKLLSAAIFGLPVLVPMIMNPFFSILSQGAAFAFVARWLVRRSGETPGRMAITVPSASTPARTAALGSAAGGLQALLFMASAVAASRWIYPSPEAIENMGMAYPAWVLSPGGWFGLLKQLVPVAVLAGGVSAAVAGSLPVEGVRRLRPSFLYASAALCAAISLLNYWLA
ncbi:MAG: hypothetical protein V1774_03715 [Candidatus Eisenbacteria bacterium]